MIASLAACFSGDLAPYATLLRAENLRADDPPAEDRPAEDLPAKNGPASLPGRALLDRGTTEGLIARFGAAYPDADRRAVVSLWSQWYFGTVIVPAAAAILRLDRDLPIALDDVRLAFRENGTAGTVILANEGAAYAPGKAGGGRFSCLVERHVAPLILHLSGRFGVSRRVLWSNAAVMLDWTCGRIEETGCGACDSLAECRATLEHRTDAAGRPNPLFGALRGCAGARSERRVCCLRYRLPGVESCGALCPLTEAQRARSGRTETGLCGLAG